MMGKYFHKIGWCALAALLCFGFGTTALAAMSGIGSVATAAQSNLTGLAKLLTSGAYVAGMAFAIGAVVKFKAHKDNPTQIPISQPIALLFIGAALIFIPSVFSTTGKTLFGASGTMSSLSGVTKFS